MQRGVTDNRWQQPTAATISGLGAVLAGLVPSVNVPGINDNVLGWVAGCLLLGSALWSFYLAFISLSPVDVAHAASETVSINLVLDRLLDQLTGPNWPDKRQSSPEREALGVSVYRVFSDKDAPRLVRIVRRRSDDRKESRREWPLGVGVAGVTWRRGQTDPHAEGCGAFDRFAEADEGAWETVVAQSDENTHFNMPYSDFNAVRAYKFVIGVPIPEREGAGRREPGVAGVLTIDCMSARHDIGHKRILSLAHGVAKALGPALERWPSGIEGTLTGVAGSKGDHR